MTYLLSYAVCVFYGILFNVRGYLLFTAAFGGAIAKFVITITGDMGIMTSFFLSSVAVALYGEFMARISKVPVMIFTIIGLLPIIPGRGFYKAMATLYQGDTTSFSTYGLPTLESVGAMVLGLMLVSSFVRIFKIRKLLSVFYFK